MKKTLALAAALTGLTFSASAAVFDFNDAAFLDMTVDSVTTSNGAVSASLTTQRQINSSGDLVDGVAAIFDTENPANGLSASNGDSDLTEGAVFTGTGFGGALIISESETVAGVELDPADDNARGGTITFAFGNAVRLLGFDILDDAEITVVAGGVSNTFDVAADGGFGSFDLTGLGYNNVTSLTFDFNGASGAIDNLSVSAVPVPAALPLLLAGIGGLAFMGRRRKAN